MLEKFLNILTYLPGHTYLIEHDIRLSTTNPIPFHSQAVVKEDVKKMLKLGVIEPSNDLFCPSLFLSKNHMIQQDFTSTFVH